MMPWQSYLSDADRAVLARGKFGARMGFGARPAVVVIDAQRYMVGERGHDAEWPSSCGETGRAALAHIAAIVAAAQASRVPCYFTRFEVERDGSDIGVYGRKRALLDSEHWCLAGTRGAELVPQLQPAAGDVVFVKKKPSGFHGTPLLGYLVNRQVDTVIVTGGATSNCVRATVFDASSYNFRTIVPQEAVFDRIPISHAISLFDMDRQFADVVTAVDTVTYLQGVGAGGCRMRSKLFVPASRPELFFKALRGPADAVSFDLEDAVEEGAKPAARGHLAALFAGGRAAMGDKRIVVRANAVETAHFAADLEIVACEAVDILNLPMVESAATVRDAVSALERIERRHGLAARIGILVNIESARGLRLATEIAAAHPRVMGLQIGYGDLFSPLGIAMAEPSATQAVRFAVRLAAGEAGIDAWDGAYVDIKNPEGFVSDARAAQRLGFAGKSCIHPSQVAQANDVFRPSQAEIAHALRVVEAARDAQALGVGAFVVDGRLVDGPFITRAEYVVELARRLERRA